MHIIVNEFINTSERLAILLEKYHDKDQYLEAVFFRFGQLINNENVNPDIYVEIDQAVITGHPDPDFYLLFISYTISFISRRKQFERAKILEDIGHSLIKEKIHPVLQAYFISAIATLRDFESKSIDRDRLIKEALKQIDRKSPRYRTILYNMAIFLADLGRLKELDKEDIDLLNSPLNKQQIYLSSEIKTNNAIILGNVEEGLNEIALIKKDIGGEHLVRLQIREYFLKLISGDFDEKNYKKDTFKNLAKICKYLAQGELHEAQKYYDLHAQIDYYYAFKMPILEYFNINLQLCLRNKGMARLLFNEIEKSEGIFYFDDLYLARLYLLEENQEEALKAFSRLIKNVNYYGAMGQLLFLIQFAKELSPLDIFNLIEQSQNVTEISVDQNKTQQEVIPKTLKGNELLIGDSFPLNQVKALIQKFSKIAEPVLVIGETGTGKELVAKAIHDEGPFANEPFLAINCGALSESLLQSELFGYVAGAFTGAQKEKQGIFEAAGKGTVFLDEFGEISPQMQASLLRLLESNEIRLIGDTKTRQIKCKLVIATNIDLHQAVLQKKFREDLYFRLTRFDIKLPPLRDRKEDIPKLINYFLESNKKLNEKQHQLSKELMDVLINYKWSGNIRELKNEIERLKILHADKEILKLEDFDFTRLHDMPKLTIPNTSNKNNAASNVVILKNDDYELDHEKILKIIEKGSKSENRRKIIKELFQTYKKVSRKQIVEITSMSPGSASKELNDLCAKGFIKKITPTKSVRSHYFVLVE